MTDEQKKCAQDWKIFRLNNLLTQRQLAHEMGISRRTVQKIEGGHVVPHPGTVRRFIMFKKRYRYNAELHGELIS